MFWQIVLAAVGLALLAYAADHLIVGSSRLAARLRISSVVVGVVVIGVGTSMPEILVSGLAAARGDEGIAMGNIVGSNILNLTLILGVAGLIATVRVTTSIIRREVRLAVFSVVVFGFLAWSGLNKITGALLLLLTVGAVVTLVQWARVGRNQELAEEVEEFTETVPASRTWVEVVRAAAGLAGVLAGAQILVVNAAAIAASLGVPQVVIGFTLVALGTSLPELMTTIQAQRRGESELVVGNLFGSNLFNGLFGGALIGLLSPKTAHAGVASLLTMGLIAVLAWGLLHRGLRLGRAEALVLLAVYVLIMPVVLAS